MDAREIIEKAKRHITPALVIHTPVVAERASGVYVYGADGKRYMDFTSGLAVTCLGHCPPAVVEAAIGEMQRLIHSGGIFYSRSQAELAERLARITPGNIEMFFFSNSGAEAVEGAIKLSRLYTGRQGVIAFTGGFHGRTLGAVTLTTSSVRYRKGYSPLLPSVYHAPYPYCFRCPMGKTRENCAVDCFEYLKTLLRHEVSPDEVACFIIEPVLGEGGYVVPPADYMERLAELSQKEKILLIADEVQSGFGRTGKWFACEHFRIAPDIITMAKGIASGFPVSALGSRREIMEAWPPGAHGTTFGGNPVSSAAALATIETIEKENLLENARRLGTLAISRLNAMKEKKRCIGDVRGLGLMIGVELVKEDSSPDRELLSRVIKSCLERGLIIIECGTDKNTARLMPPLNVKEEELALALDILEEALV